MLKTSGGLAKETIFLQQLPKMQISAKKEAKIPEIEDMEPGRKYAMASIKGDSFKIWNTRTGLWTLALILSCFLNSKIVQAESEPGPFYASDLSADPESLHLLQRLRQLTQLGREIGEQEREITDEAMAIEGVLEAKASMGYPHYSRKELSEEDIAEPLPVPSAIRSQQRYEKRGSYMALCHFKICNMGRKRQLMTQVRTKVSSPNLWVPLGPRSSSTLLRPPRS